MKKLFLILIFLSALQLLAFAAVPHLINYQGKLTDSGNNPLNGTYAITFRIYDAETAGSLLWEETQSAVVIQKGVFSVLLGSVTSLNLAFDKAYFLEIKVGNEVMTPRQRIASAGYAIRAEEAEKYNGAGKVGTKEVDETGISDGMRPYYDGASGKVKFNNSTGFGSWVAKSCNTVYQAATDGFVVVYGDARANPDGIDGYTDGNNPPNTMRASCMSDATTTNGAAAVVRMSFIMPVKKNDYWKVQKRANSGMIQYPDATIYWMPVGS